MTGCITATVGPEVGEAAPPVLSTFLVKVTARCDLACDYCYVFEHADQSWRELPARMSPAVCGQIARRIGEYASHAELTDVTVIFHGGEPLLLGAGRLAGFAEDIRSRLPASCVGHFGLQSNGLRLSAEALDELDAAGISVSVSLDGPATANDRHRLTVNGRSSFAPTLDAIERLGERPEMFAGVISVIDPKNDPGDLLAFFAELDVPQLDLLLPDATHDAPPVGRDADPEVYRRWLTSAFDVWFDEFGQMPVRTFDALVGAVAGLESPTDAFGLGDVSLVTIETDGSYHDLDVLKIAGEGATHIGGNVFDRSIMAAASSEQIAHHRRLLSLEGLSDTCKSCAEVDVCGGGAVPHRFRGGSYENPSVYCDEIKALISHARDRMRRSLRPKTDPRQDTAPAELLVEFEDAQTSAEVVSGLLDRWRHEQLQLLAYAVDYAAELSGFDRPAEEVLSSVALRPSVVLWTTATIASASGTPLSDLRGQPVPTDPAYFTSLSELANRTPEAWPDIHRDDVWLRAPFGSPIEFSEVDDCVVDRVRQAFDLIEAYSAPVAREMRHICPDVQLVQDASAHGHKVVSFSDNLVPGALYVGDRTVLGPVKPIDLADSLLHEYRHQKLYLLEREYRLIGDDTQRVRSPWREELRPPSGVLHACFVFAELKSFWRWASCSGAADDRSASVVVADVDARLADAWSILRSVELTGVGRTLVDLLIARTGT